ncbi:ATP-binding protein [Streptomyces sp. NBC_00268]|uniref:ATP-binding protein n=1 Tax=Streptomyces sp. NBC_00268 TaxID=2975695 RepID=UPI00338E2A43
MPGFAATSAFIVIDLTNPHTFCLCRSETRFWAWPGSSQPRRPARTASATTFDATVHRHRARSESDHGARSHPAQPRGQGRRGSRVAARERSAAASDRPGPLRARRPDLARRALGVGPARAPAPGLRGHPPPHCWPGTGDSSPGSGCSPGTVDPTDPPQRPPSSEFGYLDLDKKGAKLLFQIFTEREERKATAVTTNSPNEWDSIFNEPRLCAAIADRITFRCTLIQTGTDSYRFQATEDKRGTKNAR